jgi:hypothetical protein
MGETLNYKDLSVVQRAFELVQATDIFVRELPSTPQGKTVGDQLCGNRGTTIHEEAATYFLDDEQM